MNRICLIGRLTKDVEFRENETLKQSKFILAVNRDFSKNEENKTDFINCIAWNKLAETINKYVHKGDQLGIEGRLQVSKYQDKEGNNRYSTDVIIDKITFVSSKKGNQKEEIKDEGKDAFEEFSEEVELTDEDLPF